MSRANGADLGLAHCRMSLTKTTYQVIKRSCHNESISRKTRNRQYWHRNHRL